MKHDEKIMVAPKVSPKEAEEVSNAAVAAYGDPPADAWLAEAIARGQSLHERMMADGQHTVTE